MQFSGTDKVSLGVSTPTINLCESGFSIKIS